ncbi:T2R40 protein, partial [Turnix velox]|nr:T2R40 protein [Turnix velox]
IFIVSSSSCIKSRILSSYDMIVIFLSLSRFILQSWMIVDLFLSRFCETFYYAENVFAFFKALHMFLNYISFWSAAWLSVFYCIKVANFTQSTFIWLKKRISSLVPWMLITSSLFSLSTSLPFIWDVYKVHNNFTAHLTMTNSSEGRVTLQTSFGLFLLLCNAGIALPLIVFVVSSILLIRSLSIHTRQMKSGATSFQDLSLEAHIGAIKSVFSFFIFYVTYFISLVLILSNTVLNFSIEEVICITVMAAGPAGHSMVLIWSNPKFREVPARILHHVNCRVR